MMWCIDGTFSTIPAPYTQLYTISYLIDNSVFPSIYCFMKYREESTYELMFSIINDMIPDLQPEYIKTDYEKAAINAVQNQFPTAIISGCTFHLGQAIQRNLGNYNLTADYCESRRIKKYVKALSGLAFVNQEAVEYTFNEIMGDGFPESLRGLYDYFRTAYIGVGDRIPRFTIYLCNISESNSENVPRTNNAI